MTGHIVTGLIVVGGLINIVPLIGVLSAARLSASYGVDVSEPNLEILMRHRAVLFGLLGVFMMIGAFREGMQVGAIIAGLISMTSFIALAYLVGGFNGSLKLLVIADAVGAVLLVAAWVLKTAQHS